MKEGLRKLKAGDWNSINQTWLDDDTVTITLSKLCEKTIYKFTIRNLYGEHEEILQYEELGT